MSKRALRVIRVVHSLPGRLRLRLPWLHEEPDDAAALAERVAGLHPSMVVEVRPWTGSVLCRFEPNQVGAETIIARVRRETGVAIVLQPGERVTVPEEAEPELPPGGESRLTRALGDSMRGMNRELMSATGGRIDLGAVAGLSFLTLGAAEIAVARRVPAPPWFNLAWWAFRTFTLFGRPAEEGSEEEPAVNP